jgi:pyruvate formate lyase activating enzyme
LCKYCINFDLSQRRKIEGVDIPPEEVVEKALQRGCHGIAYTYNEPSIF